MKKLLKYLPVKELGEAVSYCLTLSWKSSKSYTLLRLAGRILMPATGILSTYLLKYILDLLSGAWVPSNPTVILTALIVAAAALPLLSAVLQKLVSYAEGLHNDILSQHIQRDLMDKALNADLEMFDSPQFYDRFSMVCQDSYALTYIVWNVLDCVSAAVTFIGAFVLLCSNNLIYSLLMVAAALPSAIINRKYTRLLYQFSLSQAGSERKKNYLFSVASSREYAQNVRLYGIGPLLKERYQHIWEEVFTKKKKMVDSRLLATIFLELLPHLVMGAVMLRTSLGVLAKTATIGDYSLYTGLLSKLWSGIILLVDCSTQIYENKLKIENIRSFNQVPQKISDGDAPLETVEEIRFEHVAFTYPGMETPVLRDVDFAIRPGEKVALVGLNGAGKSTMIKLLMRFYDVTAGSVQINGRDIREYRLADLRGCFGVYFQGAPNFGFTLRENIAIGRRDKTTDDAAIREALHKSGGGDLLRGPKGLDVNITRQFDETGLELSGGQHQKLALARTFYRGGSAMILDEPSSSLDPEAEEKVLQMLAEMGQGKTTLFTSHRLTNVSIADRIIVLENGRIIEDGTKEKLLRQSGRFAELYELQAEKYRGTV